MPITPYVVGQWVRSHKFYGRTPLLEEILHGNRNCLWLIGTRRVGKTSILKQLEHLASTPESPYFPLFWDFQGSEEPQDLHESFGDSLLDAFDRLDEVGIDLESVEAQDLFASMTRLRRELRSRDKKLLLLGDEVEELLTINKHAPRFLRRLRRALQSPENIRTVLASKIKLWDLTLEETSSSPFLHGFTPPLFVSGLADDEARSLICQSQLPPADRPRIGHQAIGEIRARCNNHPYLLQLLCERYLELGDLEHAVEEIATDQMVSHFFSVDFEMLTETERNIVRVIGEQHEATSRSLRERLALEQSSLRSALQRLEHLGFIDRSPEGGYSLLNYFFRRWFSDLPSVQRLRIAAASTQATIDATALDVSSGERRRIGDGRYELLTRLGRGASGEVFKAHDSLLQSVVAIKILKREYCSDEESAARLRREVLLARDLSHPNILKIYHLGDDQGLRYVTMQYVDGLDLSEVIAKEGAFAPEKAIAIGSKLAAALAVAHRANVLHRDIKPSNVLIDETGEPRITDFGLARPVDGPGITRAGIFLGTPAYASPEQISGERLDERSDLYALGVVIFEMATGRRPFITDFTNEVLFMHLESPPPDPRDLQPGISAAFSQLILRCLAKDRESRMQSAAELYRALAALAAGF